MLGRTRYLWEQGRSDLARDSWNFSAKMHPLGKKQAKSAGSHIFIFFSSNMLAVKRRLWQEKRKVYWCSTKKKTKTHNQKPPPNRHYGYFFTFYFTSATVKSVKNLVHIRDFFMRFGLFFSFLFLFFC